MAAQQSKQAKKIFSVTTSTGLAEYGWSELLRERRHAPLLEEGVPESASEESWEPETEGETGARIEPENER